MYLSHCSNMQGGQEQKELPSEINCQVLLQGIVVQWGLYVRAGGNR